MKYFLHKVPPPSSSSSTSSSSSSSDDKVAEDSYMPTNSDGKLPNESPNKSDDKSPNFEGGCLYTESDAENYHRWQAKEEEKAYLRWQAKENEKDNWGKYLTPHYAAHFPDIYQDAKEREDARKLREAQGPQEANSTSRELTPDMEEYMALQEKLNENARKKREEAKKGDAA